MHFLCKKSGMKIFLIGNKEQALELGGGASFDIDSVILRADIESAMEAGDNDCIIDLKFRNTTEHIRQLKKSEASLIIVNAVDHTLSEIDKSFVRFAGWNSLLGRTIVEASCLDEVQKEKAEKVFSLLNKRIEWLPDVPGFISCRVIAQIINEAFYSLQENVSTRDQIDTAMKLGTNYPFGPFEWAEKIGLKNVVSLLYVLSEKEMRYKPCKAIIDEANK